MPENRITPVLRRQAERKMQDGINQVRDALIAVQDEQLNGSTPFYEFCEQQFGLCREDVDWIMEVAE